MYEVIFRRTVTYAVNACTLTKHIMQSLQKNREKYRKIYDRNKQKRQDKRNCLRSHTIILNIFERIKTLNGNETDISQAYEAIAEVQTPVVIHFLFDHFIFKNKNITKQCDLTAVIQKCDVTFDSKCSSNKSYKYSIFIYSVDKPSLIFQMKAINYLLFLCFLSFATKRSVN